MEAQREDGAWPSSTNVPKNLVRARFWRASDRVDVLKNFAHCRSGHRNDVVKTHSFRNHIPSVEGHSTKIVGPVRPFTHFSQHNTMAENAEVLQAQLRALEEELARKKLEAEIRQLESQLASAKQQKNSAVVEDESEYTEVEVEDDEIVETSAPKRAPPRQWPPVKNQNKQNDNVVTYKTPEANKGATTTVASSGQGSSNQDAKPRPKWVPYSQRKAATEKKQKEEEMKKAEEEKKKGKPAVAAKPKKPKLPPLPYTKRQIPKVDASPDGEETFFEALVGKKLITTERFTKCTTNGAVQDRDFVLLLFGAKWRPECKEFFPQLDDFFKLNAAKHKMECVYISSDRTLMEFKDLFQNMPYLALPTGTAEIKNNLAKSLKIVQLPVLVVLTGEGRVVTTDGQRMIAACERRNEKQYQALVKSWKEGRTYPIDEIPEELMLRNHGQMKLGHMAWIPP